MSTDSDRARARSRRANASSSGESSRGAFGISAVKFRVGAPPLLPLPLRTDLLLDQHPDLRAFGDDFEKVAIRILGRHGFDTDSINMDSYDMAVEEGVDVCFASRSIPGDPSTSQPTILISAPWLDGSSHATWVLIVSEIKQEVDQMLDNLGRNQVTNIYVEMIAPELTMRKYMGPVVGNQALEAQWPALRTQVGGILEAFSQTRDCANIISLFRLGYDPTPEKNPITLYISLGYESKEEYWPPVALAIEQAIVKHVGGGLGVKLHIEHNRPFHCGFELLEPDKEHEPSMEPDQWPNRKLNEEYSQKVDMGADIGASLYITREDGKKCNPGFGTLGCYVEVTTVSMPQWTPMALTNYHIVRPAFRGFRLQKAKSGTVLADPLLGTDLLCVDKRGFYPNSTVPWENFENPCRRRHNMVVNRLKAAGDSVKPEWDAKIAFFDSGRHHLGSPWVGSGFDRRTAGPTRSRLNWALIRVEESRRGSNVLPDTRQWIKEAPYDFEETPLPLECARGVPMKPPQDALKTLTGGETLYKVGATTGLTIGRFSKYKDGVKLDHDKHISSGPSCEAALIGCPERLAGGPVFADRGDSGAAVWDGSGRLVGLVFTGHAPRQAGKQALAYVTPIEDVFEDIIAFSKGQITGIRVHIGA